MSSARRPRDPDLERLHRAPDTVVATGSDAEEALRLGPLTYGDDDPARWAQARQLVADHPEITASSIHAAALVADVVEVRRFLDLDPGLARAEGGPHRWEPLVYLTYSRLDPGVDRDRVLAVATLLLEAGADPNVGYLWHGLPTPFTALTGALGGGEGGMERQPPHPHSIALGRLLLEAGADANDGQALYNRQFEPRDDHLELLLELGLGRGDGGPWRARLGDEVDAPDALVQGQLWWAVVHGFVDRVRLLAEHDVDLGQPFADGRTAAEVAAVTGNAEVVALLDRLGAPQPRLTGTDAVVATLLAADGPAVEALRATDPEALAVARTARPGLVVWAAGRRLTDAVRLLVELGFDVNALARADVPSEQPWQTALHTAVAEDDAAMIRLLVSLGADPSIRDHRFDGTAADWAAHFGRPWPSEDYRESPD